MAEHELKPCPFCGGEASINKDYDLDGYGRFDSVKCRKCGAKSREIYARVGNGCPVHYATVRDAWNTRPIEDAQAARIKELEAALKKASAALNVFDRTSPNHEVIFTGKFAHMGVARVSDILDEANQALEGK